MTTLLHRMRLEAVEYALLQSGAKRIVDLGCGDGELLERLRHHPQFESVLGIDVDPRCVAAARTRLSLDLLHQSGAMQVMLGSFENSDWKQGTVDAAILLETIEHIEPGRLSKVERALFGEVRPKLVVVTTPNKEYNPLHGMSAGQKRHAGHRFEWTRAQFRHWCDGVAQRHRYTVQYGDIGPFDARLGSSTQMASFSLGSTSLLAPPWQRDATC